MKVVPFYLKRGKAWKTQGLILMAWTDIFLCIYYETTAINTYQKYLVVISEYINYLINRGVNIFINWSHVCCL